MLPAYLRVNDKKNKSLDLLYECQSNNMATFDLTALLEI
jgi:hypothetical protein